MIKWYFQRISKYEYQLKSDLPVWSDSIFLRSLSSKLKSKLSRFYFILVTIDDLGITTMTFCYWYLKAIWAQLLWYFYAIYTKIGSLKISFVPSVNDPHDSIKVPWTFTTHLSLYAENKEMT